ncbi:hypothetical protein TRFO_38085 [Tritrichomonas foetus]|uniref:Uncharacterized protein n=1 Tax=Tritrichomonas foetus TaxID=1144522 RepID=A0A1J4JAT6_9EUKA|nr:hypothetical protein TRFO_38085 [Tritrichomonas foetus]|eukprot:OHS95785.1 hypothetical protein TRFO_38085 [Tritrichomonas foetus]
MERFSTFSNIPSSRESHLQMSSLSSETALSSMIESNHIKTLRNRLFFLFTFVDSVQVNFFTLHFVISYWRILQFMMPCLAANYTNFWLPGSKYEATISIFSIFFHVVPPKYRSKYSIIVNFSYFAIILLTLVFLIIYSFYFRKTAKCNNLAADFIIAGVNGILHLFHPIMLVHSGETIGRLIMGTNYYRQSAEISGIVFAFVGLISFFVFFSCISSVSVVFRPFPLMTILAGVQVGFSVLIWMISFVTGIASQLPLIPRCVLTLLVSFLYFIGNFFTTIPGSFVNKVQKRIIAGVSTSSCLFMILVAVYEIMNLNAEMIEIFVYISASFLMVLVASFYFNKRTRKLLAFLDDIYENGTDINQINHLTEKLFLHAAVTGFVNSHPICKNWSFFKSGAEKFSESIRVWRVFGKFVAIYPEESNLLSFIVHTMQTYGNRSSFITQEIISQARTIMTQREGSLSSDLKVRLSKASKQVQVTKRKIRHIWDLVIQSSINEMDSSINNTFTSRNKAMANLSHLLAQYPNNRYAARIYAKFTLEVLVDPQLYAEWTEKVQRLTRGVMVNPDRTNILGMHAFPNLPMIQNVNSQFRQESHFTESEVTNDSNLQDIDDSFIHGSSEQVLILQEKIKYLSIPALNSIRLWTIFLYFCLIFAPAVGLLIYAPIFLDNLTKPLDLMYHVSYLRASAFQLPLFAQHYMYENIEPPNISYYYEYRDNPHRNNNLFNTLNPLNNTLNVSNISFFQIPDFGDEEFISFGNAKTTRDQLRYFITEASTSVEKLSSYRTFGYDNSDIQIVHKIIFDETIPYAFFDENQEIVMINVSLQSAMMQIIYQINNILTGTPNISWYHTVFIQDPIKNADYITDATSYALSYLKSYLNTQYYNMNNSILFATAFICVVYTIVLLGITLYQVENIRVCKSQIYQCLTVLPKNVVSSVAESLKALEKNDQSYEPQYEDEDDMNKQEESILKIFSSASDLATFGSFERLIYIILNLILLLCVLAIIVLVCQMFPIFQNNLAKMHNILIMYSELLPI